MSGAKRQKRLSVEARARHRAALKGWETRRENEERAEREAKRKTRLRQQRAREKAEEVARAVRSKAAKKGARTRKRKAEAAEEKEAVRVRKWRASYKKFLRFRIPKEEREELEIPEKVERVCRVLFDGEETGEEHFWSNIRFLIGNSVGVQLSHIPATTGDMIVTVRKISKEEFGLLRSPDGEFDPSEMGTLSIMQYETDLDPDMFWSTFFENARTELPKGPKGESEGSLLVVRMDLCFAPGEVSTE